MDFVCPIAQPFDRWRRELIAILRETIDCVKLGAHVMQPA